MADDQAAIKAAAEAASAATAAEKARLELEEWQFPSAVQQREAERERAVAAAEKDAAAARGAALTGSLPDLSGVRGSTTTVTGEQPIQGAALALSALQDAAQAVATAVITRITTPRAVLVTTGVELAASDAAHHHVRAGLDELTGAAEVLLAPSTPTSAESVGVVVGAIAGLIPSVVALLSTTRTVMSAAVPVDDVQASTAVAGALANADRDARVVHDEFRLLGSTDLDERIAELGRLRRRLFTDVTEDRRKSAEMLDEAIGAFLAALLAEPDGAQSLYMRAALRAELHTGGFEQLLLVKGTVGSATQVVSDRPLWAKDRFTVVATAGITFLLIRVADSQVLDGGTRAGTASVAGTIGDRLEITDAAR